VPIPKKPRRRKKGEEPEATSEEAAVEETVDEAGAEAAAPEAETKAPAKGKAAAKADTGEESPEDAQPEAGADTETETGADKATDTEAKAEPDDEPDAKEKRGPKAKGDPQTEADAKARAKEASKPKRRRGAAETSTRKESARPAPRRESDGAVQVRAQARYVRSAPRKARLVMAHIRGKRVDDARAILRHTPRAAAADIAKLLDSAVANAENNFELDPDDLKIDRAFVDEGPTIKRYRPRALGRATPIHKRTSHMTITLTTEKKG